jgi:segregation and condensation protein A
MQQYTIKTSHFEGPFDLLLFFIERDELDIYDIPIHTITEDFLAYIKELESLNIDIASEFILVAATLMRIKAKMLIPRKELDEDGNEIDPREELAQKLLEYKQFKEVLDDFSNMEDIRHLKHYRGNAQVEIKQLANKALVDVELESLSLINLLKAFRNVMHKYEEDKNKIIHTIQRYPYTIEQQQNYIKNIIPKKGKIEFRKVFLKLENRVHAIVTFLALLELLNGQLISVIQGEGINNFWLERIKGD